MDANLLGKTINYFLVGKKNEEVFPVHVSGFTAIRASDIQRAKWYTEESTATQMVQLLNMFAQLNGDSTVFEGRRQLIEYTKIGEEEQPTE